MTATETATAERMPWDLLPSEVVCPDCHYAHHKHLPDCPVCKEQAR